MANRFRVSTTLPRKLEELGLSPQAVLRQAGLPMGLFNQDKILVSTEEFFALYRGIAESSGDPRFGLKLGTEERVERYDPIKLAAVSARLSDLLNINAFWSDLNFTGQRKCAAYISRCAGARCNSTRFGFRGRPMPRMPDANYPCETYVHE